MKVAIASVFGALLIISAGALIVHGNSEAGLTSREQLGKSLFFEKISDPDSMSCSVCHNPNVGWTGPIPGINLSGAVYRGAVPTRFGNRKPPSAAYATLSPILHYDAGEGLFVGGNFWNGRATGEMLGNPAADQALGSRWLFANAAACTASRHVGHSKPLCSTCSAFPGGVNVPQSEHCSLSIMS